MQRRHHLLDITPDRDWDAFCRAEKLTPGIRKQPVARRACPNDHHKNKN
jgi:hypothetical protein